MPQHKSETFCSPWVGVQIGKQSKWHFKVNKFWIIPHLHHLNDTFQQGHVFCLMTLQIRQKMLQPSDVRKWIFPHAVIGTLCPHCSFQALKFLKTMPNALAGEYSTAYSSWELVSLEKLEAGLKEIRNSFFAEKWYMEARHQLYANFLKKVKKNMWSSPVWKARYCYRIWVYF